MSGSGFALPLTAVALGLGHTLLGPDHWLPFVALARARNWSLRRTFAVTAACGVGHVAGSVVLGGIGIAAGWALSDMQSVEGIRGSVAGWLLFGFGLAYLVWGVRQGLRSRPHEHVHAHGDGTVHRHVHTHEGAHLHVHERPGGRSVTGWVLFVIFVFGPCEPLIPLLMVPAAVDGVGGVAMVALIFLAATVAAMLVAVGLALRGSRLLGDPPLERWAHALAGAALVACGAAVRLGF